VSFNNGIYCSGGNGTFAGGNWGINFITPGGTYRHNILNAFNELKINGRGDVDYVAPGYNGSGYIGMYAGNSGRLVTVQNDTYKLDVNGNVNVSGGMRITSYITGNNGITSQQTYVYLNKDFSNVVVGTAGAIYTNGGYEQQPLAINADYHIKTGSYLYAQSVVVFSDERIKNNIVDIEDGNALSILRKIQPKTYDYKDKVKRGNSSVIGFVAQEVKEVLPKAVSITTDYIPNFYTICQTASTDVSNIVLVTSPVDLSWNPLHDSSGNAFVDASGNACSDASGNTAFNVKLYDQSNNEIECKTTDVLDKRSFLMDISGSTIIAGNQYFLYGQEVNDFHTLDKSAIFTVVTAAVQDMDRIIQAQAGQIQAQHVQIQAQQVLIQELQQQMAAVLSKLSM
jgi:hypothetical protein